MDSFFRQGASTSTGSSSSAAEPYATWGLGQAQNVATAGMNGAWVPGLNGDQQNAMGQIRSLATGANPLTDSAYGGLTNFLSNGGMTGGTQEAMGFLRQMANGGTAGQNPALQGMMQDNANLVANKVNSMASGIGRTGSNAHVDQMARSITAANNPLISQAYESDMGRQLQASGLLGSLQGAADGRMIQGMSMAPIIDAQRYAGAEKLAGIGDVQRSLSQEQAQAGKDSLGWFGSLLAGTAGSMPTTNTTVSRAAAPSGAQQAATWAGLLGSFL